MSRPPVDDSQNGEEDEFSAADLGSPQYRQPVVERPPRKPEPWHRPRKQFVRKFQWVTCLKDIYSDRDPADHVNYLGLPGTDLLDLRVFYEEVCVPQRRMLRFLGFHDGIGSGSPEAVSLDVSLQQVKLRELVHEGSKVLPDDINRIGSDSSLAFQEARRTAPYDVINLDFTVGYARDAPRGLDSMYNALNQIIAMQRRLQPWLLLITGLIARDVSDSEAARVLHGLFLDALECEGFPEACSVYFETAELNSLDIDTCSDRDYFYAIAIGFCIWVFSLAQANSASRVNLRAAFCYQVNPEGPCPDLVSMAIRFRPHVVATPDPSGLAVGDTRRQGRCEASLQFARRFVNAVDVDQKLENDNDLRDELINETAQLLVDAGYDEGDYLEFVAQFTS